MAARVRRETRSQSSKAKESEPELETEKKVTERRTSRRTAGKAATCLSVAGTRGTKKVAAKKKVLVKKEIANKKGGVKRSSSARNNPKPSGGASKKAKTLETKASKAKTAIKQKNTRSRSRSVVSRVNAKKKSTERQRDIVVNVIPAESNCVVPQDFGLKRDSFNGQNFTYGIAHYDASERSNPLRCKDYVTDMFQYYFDAEVGLLPLSVRLLCPFMFSHMLTIAATTTHTFQTIAHPGPYMDRQEDINAKMRAILIDWLVEVHMKFRLVPETLYLCVHIIDRYCSIAVVARSKLQLVGVTALFLACKHEEIYPPEVRDCVYITDRAYDRQEVLDMEQTLLRVLDWRISLPTVYPFLDRFLSITNASPMTRAAASYYLERTLQEYDLLEYRPSLVCASVVILALNNPDIRIQEEEYQRELPGLVSILLLLFLVGASTQVEVTNPFSFH